MTDVALLEGSTPLHRLLGRHVIPTNQRVPLIGARIYRCIPAKHLQLVESAAMIRF